MNEHVDLIVRLLEAHKDRLDSIDDSLREHMRRTDVLEKLHMDNQKRIETLETPFKYIKNTKAIIITLGKIASAIAAIIAIVMLFKKL